GREPCFLRPTGSPIKPFAKSVYKLLIVNGAAFSGHGLRPFRPMRVSENIRSERADSGARRAGWSFREVRGIPHEPAQVRGPRNEKPQPRRVGVSLLVEGWNPAPNLCNSAP